MKVRKSDPSEHTRRAEVFQFSNIILDPREMWCMEMYVSAFSILNTLSNMIFKVVQEHSQSQPWSVETAGHAANIDSQTAWINQRGV